MKTNLYSDLRKYLGIGIVGLGMALGTSDAYADYDFSKDSEKVLLAKMIYGEARNCQKDERIAIAYTAINRANDGKKWNGTDVKSAILCPYQYSCFNKNDINRKKLENPKDKTYDECLSLADKILAKKYQDKLKATHYHTKQIKPKWASSKDMKKIGSLEKHIFYREK